MSQLTLKEAALRAREIVNRFPQIDHQVIRPALAGCIASALLKVDREARRNITPKLFCDADNCRMPPGFTCDCGKVFCDQHRCITDLSLRMCTRKQQRIQSNKWMEKK